MIHKRAIRFTGKLKSVKLEKIEMKWVGEKGQIIRKVTATSYPSLLQESSSFIRLMLDETGDSCIPTTNKLKIEDSYDVLCRNNFDIKE